MIHFQRRTTDSPPLFLWKAEIRIRFGERPPVGYVLRGPEPRDKELRPPADLPSGGDRLANDSLPDNGPIPYSTCSIATFATSVAPKLSRRHTSWSGTVHRTSPRKVGRPATAWFQPGRSTHTFEPSKRKEYDPEPEGRSANVSAKPWPKWQRPVGNRSQFVEADATIQVNSSETPDLRATDFRSLSQPRSVWFASPLNASPRRARPPISRHLHLERNLER